MARHNRQTNDNFWRPFTVLIGGLSTGLCALVVLTQMTQQAFAEPATIAVGNAMHKAVVQRAAAVSVKDGAKVTIVNFEFMPAEIAIRRGESVAWVNDDGAPHGIEYHDGGKGTDLLLPGASFSRRFDRAGSYDYSCSVHPYMTGRVVVSAK